MSTLALFIIGAIAYFSYAAKNDQDIFNTKAEDTSNTTANSDISLADLIVLNGIFNPNMTEDQAKNLAMLIAVDNITKNLDGQNIDNLANLLVINGLFDHFSARELASLIATDRVINDGS